MKHLIVISVDALVYEDLEFAYTLPHFKYLLDNGSQIKRVKTIYPSLTHPVHSAILTGAPAGKTGIINNLLFDKENPDKRSDAWYNNLTDIKCDTLIHAAKRSGLTVACASFPLTSYHGGLIDYLLPNALNFYFDESDDEPMAVFRKLGASDEMLDIISDGVALYGHRDEHPSVEELQAFCSAEIIRCFKPNLLLTHPSYVDNRRHATGVFSEDVKKAIVNTDRWIGMLMDAARDAGIFEECDFVILSDHGQINITRIAYPNYLLKEHGFIKTDEAGSITEWRAFAEGAGASAQIYLFDPSDLKTKDSVYRLLSDASEHKLYGFETVFTADELKEKFGLAGDFSFVLEGDGFTGFGAEISGTPFSFYESGNYQNQHGTHGHLPDKGPQPTFIGCGPHFKKGVRIEEGDILNHAPTLAHLLGVTLLDSVGTAVSEILK